MDVLGLENEVTMLTKNHKRHCADWLAQFLFAIDNGIEQPTNLYGGRQHHNPRSPEYREREYDGTITTAGISQQRQPEIMAYSSYIPPESRISYEGKRVWLYTDQVADIKNRLENEGLLPIWTQYSLGGSFQIYYYHSVHKRMQKTPKAREMEGISRAAMVIFEYFERQL